jgi:hypothetical protein
MPLRRRSADGVGQRRLGAHPDVEGWWLVAVALCGAACSLALDVDDYEFSDPTGSAGGSGASGGEGGVPPEGGAGGGLSGGGKGGGSSGIGGDAPTPINAPVAVFDTYSFDRGAAYVVADGVGVLANDAGSPLTAVATVGLPTERGGSVALGELGGFTYTPSNPAFWGDDYFRYTVENADGQSTMGRVRLSVQPGTVALADVVGGAGNGLVIAGASIDAPVGNSVAGAGDVNGDGLADVIVGAPNADASNVGSAYVVLGARVPVGVPALPALSVGSFPEGRGFAIDAVLADGRAGTSVDGAGDVNGDGYADVIVGAPAPDSLTDGGAAFVIFGKPDGVSVSVAELVAGGTKGFRMDGSIAGDRAGQSVAGAGDVNGDGLADVIVSAPYASSGFGEAYVVYGKTSGTPVTLGDFSDDGFTIRGPAEEAIDLSATGVGDVNGDGLADVGLATASGVYVVYGSEAAADVDLAALVPAQGFAVRGADESELADSEVSAAGDVNGDGYDDIILGAPLRQSAAVVFGRPSRGDLSLDALTALDGFVITIGAMYEGQSVGFSVSGGGDLNGDGLSDVFITNFNQEGGDYPDRAFWIFGATSATPRDLSNLQDGIVIEGVETELRGAPVSSAGDTNGDGLDDWIVGLVNTNSVNDAYVLYGWDTSQNLGDRARALQGARDGGPLTFDGSPLISATGSSQQDVLAFSGAGLTLDLGALTPRLSSIEEIDLTGNGNNTLLLTDAAIRRIPDTRVGAPANLGKTLIVVGDPGDRVIFDRAGYGDLPSNAGRAVLGKTGAFYGLEITSTDMIVAP